MNCFCSSVPKKLKSILNYVGKIPDSYAEMKYEDRMNNLDKWATTDERELEETEIHLKLTKMTFSKFL